jgi:hypothetical protein
MATTNDKDAQEALLEVAIEEQRRVYDGLCDNHQQVKSRTVVFLAAAFAAMTFLYSDGKIFYPTQQYGRIFYLAALGLVLFGFTQLFIALQGTYWEFPTERARLLKLDFPTRKRYLEYVRDRYIYCYDHNVQVCEKKHKLLKVSFTPLIIGVTILVLMKIFKG